MRSDDDARKDYERAVADLVARLGSSEMELAAVRRHIDLLTRILGYEVRHGVPEVNRLRTRLTSSTRDRSRTRRTGIISDVHGNYEGLVVVLDDAAEARCDRIICLGDLVDGGPGEEEVVREISARGIPCVRGNHDEAPGTRLPAGVRAYLRDLPEFIGEDDHLYTHISPRESKQKIDHAVEAWNVFNETPYRRIFVGHVHIPLIFGERSGEFGAAMAHDFSYGRPYRLDANDRYIICVGSVGYGRDRLGKLRYAIVDHDADTIEMRAISGPLLAHDHAPRWNA